MIPRAYITEWAARAPWPTQLQIEQDLVLSRLIIEIANDPLLRTELAFRGGTCLHKIWVGQALRYSEDLDYVRTTRSAIKPYITAIRNIGERVGLEIGDVERSGQIANVELIASPTDTVGRIRIKVEMNIAETTPFRPLVRRPYQLNSSWWTGSCEVQTFELEEILGTKVRALYQRRKGRDLFDLWIGFSELDVTGELVMKAFHHYMGDRAFSYKDLERNLKEKLTNAEFLSDLENLVTQVPKGYNHDRAALLVLERLRPHLR